MGYHLAGHDVTGVDIAPQPRYPFTFIQADATKFPLNGYDLIHASPPCQSYSAMSNCRPGLAQQYPMLVEYMRARLNDSGIPFVLENVPGSGVAQQEDFFGANGLTLCGAMFTLELYRHRLFETSFPTAAPSHSRHLKPASRAGHWVPGTVISVAGSASPKWKVQQAMGIDWMTVAEMAEAIPPAFTKYIAASLPS